VKSHLIRQLIDGRVGKTLTLTFVSGEVVNAKIIAANQDLEEDVDFYFIDLDRAPDEAFLEGREPKSHVFSGVYNEVREAEIPKLED
jgi:hypothetical protein